MLRLMLLVCSVAVFHALATPTFYDLDKAEELFEEFIVKHNRNYENEAEKSLRYKIFVETLKEINTLNENAKTGRYGINKFSDVTNEEMEKFKGLSAFNSTTYGVCANAPVPSVDAPTTFDWRSYGCVTPVKDQQTCGSCWAFSTIGNVESRYLIKYRQMVQLSEQQLVDCDQTNYGCNGGLPETAVDYIINAGGVMLEEGYPYVGQQNPHCAFNPSSAVVRLTGCNLYNCDEDSLKSVLKEEGPLSILVAAQDFKNYQGGILDFCNPNNQIDHAVLLVGYGEENNVPFWAIKNSWNTNFGESGYIRVRRGVNSCNMLGTPIVSTVIA